MMSPAELRDAYYHLTRVCLAHDGPETLGRMLSEAYDEGCMQAVEVVELEERTRHVRVFTWS